jgi:hypothetical protein
VPLQPVLNLKAPELDGRVIVHGATPLTIVGMDTVEPTGPNLVLDRTAAVCQPRAIEVPTKFVGVSAPDHHGRNVDKKLRRVTAFEHRIALWTELVLIGALAVRESTVTADGRQLTVNCGRKRVLPNSFLASESRVSRFF